MTFQTVSTVSKPVVFFVLFFKVKLSIIKANSFEFN